MRKIGRTAEESGDLQEVELDSLLRGVGPRAHLLYPNQFLLSPSLHKGHVTSEMEAQALKHSVKSGIKS